MNETLERIAPAGASANPSVEASLIRLAQRIAPEFKERSHVEALSGDAGRDRDLVLRRMIALVALTSFWSPARMLITGKTMFSLDEAFAVATHEVSEDREIAKLIRVQRHLRRLTNVSTNISLQFVTEDYVRGI